MIDKDGRVLSIKQLIGVDQDFELFISTREAGTKSIEFRRYPMGGMYRVEYDDGQVVLVNPIHIIEVVCI